MLLLLCAFVEGRRDPSVAAAVVAGAADTVVVCSPRPELLGHPRGRKSSLPHMKNN